MRLETSLKPRIFGGFEPEERPDRIETILEQPIILVQGCCTIENDPWIN